MGIIWKMQARSIFKKGGKKEKVPVWFDLSQADKITYFKNEMVDLRLTMADGEINCSPCSMVIIEKHGRRWQVQWQKIIGSGGQLNGKFIVGSVELREIFDLLSPERKKEKYFPGYSRYKRYGKFLTFPGIDTQECVHSVSIELNRDIKEKLKTLMSAAE